MSDLLALTVALPARRDGLAENAPSGNVARAETGDEPKIAFEDTPALAKLREERRADKKHAGEAGSDECPGPCEAAGEPPKPPATTSKPERAGRGACEKAKDGPGAHEPQRSGPAATNTAAAAVAAGGSPQVVSGQSKTTQQADGGHRTLDGRLPSSVARSVVAKTSAAAEKPAPSPVMAQNRGTPTRRDAQVTAEGSGVTSRSAAAAGTQKPAPQKAALQMPDQKGQKAENGRSSSAALRPAATAAVESSAKAQTPVTPAKPEGDGKVASRSPIPSEAKSDQREGMAGRVQRTDERGRKGDGHPPGFSPGRASTNPTAPGSGDSLKEQVEVSVSTTNGPAAFAQRLSAQEAGTPSAADTPAPKGSPQSVSEQIFDSVRASLAGGDKQVTVRLNPPELGAVTVRFQEQGDQVRAVLEVSRSDTRQEVERAMPELLRTLQESGVQIRRVEVVLSDQSGRDLSRDHLAHQDTWTGHQTPQQHAGQMTDDRGQRTEGRRQLAPSSVPAAPGSSTSDLSPAGRIDMLM